MRNIRFVLAGVSLCAMASAAEATTLVIFVEPMTLHRYTAVIDTPGPDRVLMCMAPPAASDCQELPVRRRR